MNNVINKSKPAQEELDANKSSIKELLAYADFAKLMVSQAIRDLDSLSRSSSTSAKKWIFDDSFSASTPLSFQTCCSSISIGLGALGYSCEITPDIIRKKVLSSSRAERSDMARSFSLCSESDVHTRLVDDDDFISCVGFSGLNDHDDLIDTNPEQDLSGDDHDYFGFDGSYPEFKSPSYGYLLSS